MILDAQDVRILDEMVFWHGPRRTRNISDAEVVNFIGTTPQVFVEIWSLLQAMGRLRSKVEPLHLLWTLYVAKKYPTQRDLQTTIRVDRKTYRKKTRPIRRAFLLVKRSVVSNYQCCFLTL